MSTGALDPLIHDPERLRIIATLAALSDGDALSVTRLQDLIGLTPDSPITGLRELDHAGYVRTGKTGDDRAQTTVALTGDGRAALDRYTAVLRLARDDHQAPAPHERVGDADRETAAAALGEHFVQGRLTLDELNARLDATLTARTHGELSQAGPRSARSGNPLGPGQPSPGVAADLEDAPYALAYPGIWSLIFCSSASSEMPWKS